MDLAATLAALERAGSAQTRKTYARHGAKAPMFGVSYAALYALQKRIGVDDALAEQLWRSKIHDARVLATLVADPARMTAARLERWVRRARDRFLALAFPRIAALSPVAPTVAHAWIDSDEEYRCAAGWMVLAALAARPELADATFAPLLARLQRTIHSLPNFARYAANACLIAIGRRPGLRSRALAVAEHVGAVDVDHGDTECKTPDARRSIAKAAMRGTPRRSQSAPR
jgi:3-methyladenine DNA glycosylase AlkD